MNPSELGIQSVKVIALSVQDSARARRFYGETLGLETLLDHGEVSFPLGPTILILKENYALPTATPNPRITLAVDYAPDTEQALRKRGVTIADVVDVYEGKYYVGSFLDSEGNKLWFCSELSRPQR